MSFLPKKSILGELSIEDVYCYYDYPVLFVCKNTEGKRYVVVEISRDTFRWLYVEVDYNDLIRVESNKISLYDLYKNSGNKVYSVIVKDGIEEISLISTEELTDDMLPKKEQYLNI